MPTANQVPPLAFRISSIGLAQSPLGRGVKTSLILKSPPAERGTSAGSELCSVNGPTASQIKVAKTFCPVALPAVLPPAKTKPFPKRRAVRL